MVDSRTLRPHSAPSRETPDFPSGAVSGDRYRTKLVAGSEAGVGVASLEADIFPWTINVGDQATALTAAASKWVGRVPFACRLVAVRASVFVAPTTSTILIDVNKGAAGTSMLSTKLMIDATEKTSTTAATPYVIDTAQDDLVDDAEVAIDIDQIGSGVAGSGLKVVLYLQRT